MELQVDIVSAEGEIFQGSATMVIAPAELGEIGVAPRHAPLLTRLRPGTVRVKGADGEEQQFFVSGGLLEVQPQLVTILADTALRARDADEAAAQRAKQDAEERLANAKSETDFARAQAELIEAAARLEFVRKLHGGH
jgi:F-type H+-transporting ATPase subunit epsilon